MLSTRASVRLASQTKKAALHPVPLAKGKPRGIKGPGEMSLQTQFQSGMIKCLKKQNGKKTANPSRSFNIIVNKKILLYLKKKYNMTYKLQDCLLLAKDLGIFSSIVFQNCKGNNPMEILAMEGSLVAKLNKQSFQKCNILATGELQQRRIPNKLTLTVKFTRVIRGTATQLQVQQMDEFLAAQE